PHPVHPVTVPGLLLWRERPVDLGPPGLRNTGSPVAECSSWDPISVKDIPSRIVSGISVTGEAMQPAVRLNHCGRMKASPLDCRPELVHGVVHGLAWRAGLRPASMTCCGRSS